MSYKLYWYTGSVVVLSQSVVCTCMHVCVAKYRLGFHKQAPIAMYGQNFCRYVNTTSREPHVFFSSCHLVCCRILASDTDKLKMADRRR